MKKKIDERKRKTVSGSLLKQSVDHAAFWLTNARYHSFTQSLIPALLTLLVTAGKEGFRLDFALLAVVGTILSHGGANLLDDYFDFRGESVQVRQAMLDGGMRARGRKCAYLMSGRTTPSALLRTALTACLSASAVGMILCHQRGTAILGFALIGAFLLFFYSAPPFRLSFHGLGELTVGVVFGPILMNGVAWAALGHLDSQAALLSVPVGLLAANILYTHSILDLEPDRRAGKMTLAVLFGTPKRGLVLLTAFLTAVYLSTAAGIVTEKLPKTFYLVFLTLPMTAALWRMMVLYVRRPDQKIERRFWMGPMERWDSIKKSGIDWFMIRWFLSRNLMTAYVFLAAAAVVWARFLPK